MSFILFFLVNVVRIIKYALLARVILSWLQPGHQKGRFAQIVYEITEPILKPIRNFMPRMGMFDLSVLIAYILLEVLEGYLNGYYLSLI